MANKVQILDKIERNLKQRGLDAVRNGQTVEVAGLEVTYSDKEIQKPMGGVDDSQSPFLGVGIAAPGSIKIKGTGTDQTIAAMFDSLDAMNVYHEAAGFANDVAIEAQNGTDLGRVRGMSDWNGLGS